MVHRWHINNRILFLLILTILAIIPSAGEEATPTVEKCGECNGTGKVKDSKCPEKCAFLHCSYCYDLYESHGFGFLVCPKCKGAQDEWNLVEADYKKWLEKRRDRIDRWVFADKWEKYKIGHCESEHFTVCGTLRDSTVYINNKQIKADARGRAHLFLERAEKCYNDHFLRIMGLQSYEPEDKWDMTFWSGQGEILTASNRLVGNSQAGISTYQAKLLTIEDVGEDKALHQAVIFNLALLWVEEYEGFVDGGLPDWLWEGFAHYIEYATFGSVENNCNDEALGTIGLTGKNLETKLKVMCRKGKYPKLLEFNDLNVSKLTPDMRAVAWGLIDWLQKEYGPKKFELFVRLLKRTKSPPSAFRDAYGLKWDEVSTDWEKWVLANY